MPRYDPEDIKRLANLEPHQLPKTLSSDTLDAVVKYRRENNIRSKSKPVQTPEALASLEKLKKKTQRRNARKGIGVVRRGEGGKIESTRTPIAPLSDTPVKSKPDSRFIAPVPTPRTNQTRSGKKINKETGKVAIPSVKRGASGKAIPISEEEKKASATTVLPTAGRNVMQPKQTPELIQPVGILKRGGQRKLRGFGVKHAVVKSGVDAALTHLGNMKSTLGTKDFHEHHENFNAIHANVSQMDSGLGLLLGQAKHQTITNSPKSDKVLGQIHGLIKSRLAEGKQVELERLNRSQGTGN
jgi:hypothetical protein